MKDYSDLGYFNIITKEYGFFESFAVGFNKFTSQIASYGVQLKKYLTQAPELTKGLVVLKPFMMCFQAFGVGRPFGH